MKYYETKKDLLKAFAEETIARVRPKLSWGGPYDEKDLQELLDLGGFARKRRGNSKNKNSMDSMVWRKIQYEDLKDLIDDTYEFAGEVRRKLGISNPIKPEETKDLFLKLGWAIDVNDWTTATYFPYLKADKATSGYRICEVGIIGVKGKDDTQKLNIFYLQSAVSVLSWLFHLHPAVSLAVILCDLSEFPDIVTVVRYPSSPLNERITINIATSNISPKVVSAMYSAARVIGHTEKSDNLVWPRYRVPAKKTSTLLQFLDDNKRLKWEQLWGKWNEGYPSQRYKDINSMRSAYYRAKRKWQK